jgi:predicted nucleotidyltransferase component of viral defense system
MNQNPLSPLQIREIFHLEFLRRLVREAKPDTLALKGGVNLRFYFNSPRYSEDMDIDCADIPVSRLQDMVMGILSMRTFLDTLSVYGILRVAAPDLRVAKQTETTQRFKVHLYTESDLDLFTKIEFSRRGFSRLLPIVEEIPVMILKWYRIAPFMAPHYPAPAALAQKISALAGRSTVQARDIFDIYILRTHVSNGLPPLSAEVTSAARKNVFAIDYERFRDTVIEYLTPDEQEVYGTRSAFDDIQLHVDSFIARLETRKT